MVSDKDSGMSQRQLCPFCGKSFKRLKTHLPHCKMAPVAKEMKSSKAPSETCSSIPERTFSENRTPATDPEGLSDTNLTGTRTHLSMKSRSTDVSLNTVVTKVSQKNCPKFGLSSGRHEVKAKAQEKLGMTKEDPDERNTPVCVRDAVSEEKGKGSISLKARSYSRAVEEVGNCESTPKKGQLRSKTSKTKVQQIWMPLGPLNKVEAKGQNLLPGSWPCDIVAAEGKARAAERSLSAQEIASSRSASDEHHRTKANSWDCNKADLTDKSYSHLLTADLRKAVLRVEPTFKEVESQSSLAAQSELLHKQRPENLFSTVSNGSTLYHNPSSTLWESCRQRSPVAGLEWTPDLAAAYRSIGFSMLPLLSTTDRVQRKTLPVQPVAGQVQGSRTERPFLELRLVDLPAWLMSRPLAPPQQGVSSLQKGRQWYHRKYISGLAMLLGGYCILSYVWSYPCLKHQSYRKYH